MTKWTDEQLDAINKEGTNILVSAGAGSGKTAVLSERVLRKVKEHVSVEDILVLTFTNAAAKEMKDRIRKKISDYPELKDELDKIDSAYITTFDSFALSIVNKYHYMLDLPEEVGIGDQNVIDLKKKEILDNLFLELYEKNDSNFLKLIDTYCFKDDEDLKDFILSANKNLDLLYDKNDFLESFVNNYFKDSNIDSLINEYIAIVDYDINDIKNKIDEIYKIDDAFGDKTNEMLKPLTSAKTYEEKKFGANVSFSSLRLPRGACDKLKELKEEIKKDLEDIVKKTRFDSIEQIKSDLIDLKSLVGTLIDIIQKFDFRINVMKKEYNLYEFNDIAKLSIKILVDNENIRNELKYKFNEILIDEYQDTSDLQDLFISQIENHNVYMVGDIKQSIYRFRNANPMLFKTKYANYLKHQDGEKIDLNKNFRSRKEVLNNINLMFNYLMDERIGGADYRNLSSMIFGNTSYDEAGFNGNDNNFEILNYNYDKETKESKEEIEIFTICKDIKNKIESEYKVFSGGIVRPCTYSDFAILIDRSTNFNMFKKIFEYLGVPLNIYKEESIKDNVDIILINNIIKLLLCLKDKNYHERFRYSVISIARSYLYRLSDNEIYHMNKDFKFFESDILKIASDISKGIDEKSLYSIVDEIIDKYGFYNKIITVGNVRNHMVTLDYIKKLSLDFDLIYSLREFSDFLDEIINGKLDIELSIKEEDSNSVKIMTIHKSKGLEFPICYFAFLDKEFNISDLKEKYIFDKQYGFIIPSLNNTTLITKDLLKKRYLEEEISEKIRLFYVALTRAKEKMILVANLTGKMEPSNRLVVDDEVRLKYRSFKDFLESIYNSIKDYIKPIDIDELNIDNGYNLSIKGLNVAIKEGSLIKTNDLIIENTTLEKNIYSKKTNSLKTDDEKKNEEFGTLMHEVLEGIDITDMNYSKLPVNYIDIITPLLELLNKDKILNYYQEYEFIYQKDNSINHGVMDLVVEYEDYYLILDYKLSNITDSAYVNQLNGYKDFLSTKTKKDIKIALYSILNKEIKYV